MRNMMAIILSWVGVIITLAPLHAMDLNLPAHNFLTYLTDTLEKRAPIDSHCQASNGESRPWCNNMMLIMRKLNEGGELSPSQDIHLDELFQKYVIDMTDNKEEYADVIVPAFQEFFSLTYSSEAKESKRTLKMPVLMGKFVNHLAQDAKVSSNLEKLAKVYWLLVMATKDYEDKYKIYLKTANPAFLVLFDYFISKASFSTDEYLESPKTKGVKYYEFTFTDYIALTFFKEGLIVDENIIKKIHSHLIKPVFKDNSVNYLYIRTWQKYFQDAFGPFKYTDSRGRITDYKGSLQNTINLALPPTKITTLQFQGNNEEYELFQDRLNRLLPHFYKEHLPNFFNYIFSDLPQSPEEEKTPPLSQQQGVRYTVIYNQKSYEDSIEDFYANCQNNCFEGQPIYTNGINTSPVGYNIHIPENFQGLTMVKVYGGFGKHDREADALEPGTVDNLDNHLLSQGIAIVTLNTPEMLELEVDENQLASAEMPEDIYQNVQAAIHSMWDNLKNAKISLKDRSPNDKLDQLVKSMAQGKFFLFGHSYGGGVTLRHAQLYPQTFDGYISHNGWLSHKMGRKTDIRVFDRDYSATTSYVSPLNESFDTLKNKTRSDIKITQIQSPILLLHNFDDNNVNVLVTLKWYLRALESGKGDIIHLALFNKGHSMNVEEPWHKSHGIPDGTTFEKYANTISLFMSNPYKTQKTFFTEDKARKYVLYAYQNYKKASVEKKFFAIAFRKYQFDRKMEREKTRDYAHWKVYDQWQDPEAMYTVLAFLEEIKNNPNLISTFVDDLINVLNDEQIDKTVKFQVNLFSQYLKETLDELRYIPLDIIQEALNTDSAKAIMRKEFKQWLQAIKANINDLEEDFPDFHHYLFYTILIANPELFPIVAMHFNKPPDFQEKMHAAIEKLQLRIHQAEH